MKKIDKFVLKSYLGPMVLTFLIVMFVLMMNFVWRYIDDLVGKGLDGSVIVELLCYAMANMIPMGLPLATLFAAIMTMVIYPFVMNMDFLGGGPGLHVLLASLCAFMIIFLHRTAQRCGL